MPELHAVSLFGNTKEKATVRAVQKFAKLSSSANTFAHHPLNFDPARAPSGWDKADLAAKKKLLLSEPARRDVSKLYAKALQGHTAKKGQPDAVVWYGHGELVNLKTGEWLDAHPFDAKKDVPEFPPKDVVATLAAGGDEPTPRALLTGIDLMKHVGHMPKTLWMSLACYSCWEPSLALGVLKGGCKYFIGSRRSWMGVEADQFLRPFIVGWAQADFAPDKVEATFAAAAKKAKGLALHLCLFTAADDALPPKKFKVLFGGPGGVPPEVKTLGVTASAVVA
ncbi:MAG TPA: hypothetical protein VHF22_10030 [Planctomycetota bacterium]|nr:hypothetical protein [Planctomycetota bacterium]